MKKIVSYSLYGTGDKYINGIKDNIELFPHFYPNWEMRVYYAEDLEQSIKELLFNTSFVNAIEMPVSNDAIGMFWRFLPIDEPDSIVVVRDIDSRPMVRDAILVNHWLTVSGKKAHVVRDHHGHYNEKYPMYGGMWGVVNGIGHSIRPAFDSQVGRSNKFWGDMQFLKDNVWPHICNDVVEYDGLNKGTGTPIPHFRTDYSFIGEVYYDRGPGGYCKGGRDQLIGTANVN